MTFSEYNPPIIEKARNVSIDTTMRDIQDLVWKGILRRIEEGGGSTNYVLVEGQSNYCVYMISNNCFATCGR